MGELRLVQAYKHLGHLCTPTGNQLREFAKRAAGANKVLAAVGKPILGCRSLPRKQRVGILIALIDSVLLSAAGWWPPLEDHEMKILNAPRARAIKRAAGILPGPGGPNDRQIRLDMDVPSLRTQLAAVRLRYAARVHRSAPDQLKALLSDDAAEPWWNALCSDTEHMQRLMLKKLEGLPPLALDPRPWQRLWYDFPAVWKELVKKYTHLALAEEKNLFARTPLVQAQEDQVEGTFACAECDRKCRSNAALRAHLFAAHGQGRWYKGYALSGACPSCRSDFHTRPRLLQHLAKAQRCQAWLLDHPEFEGDHKTVHAALLADRAERSVLRALGAQNTAATVLVARASLLS